MKKHSASLWIGASVLLLAAVYSSVLFFVKRHFDVSAWVLFGFTLAAFVLLFLQTTAAARSTRSIVTDTALSIVTLLYFFLQFVFGGIVCMRYDGLPLTPVVVGEAVLLTVYLILAFVVFGAQTHSEEQDRNDEAAFRRFRLLENDIRGMGDGQRDPNVKAALEKLAEEIHYSDPAALPGLADVEERITEAVAALRADLEEENGEAPERVETIRRLLRERERTAAARKR